MIRKSHVLIAAITTFFFVIIYSLLNHYLDGTSWAGMKLSITVARHEYCEYSNMDAFLRQNMNSYSNLAYFFFGMIALLSGISDYRTKNNKNTLTRFPILSILCGCSFIYLCFGSTFFHASLTWYGQCLDMNGTYSLAISLLLISLYRLLHRVYSETKLKKVVVCAYFILVGVFVYLHGVISSFVLLPAMILGIATLAVISMVRHKTYQADYAFLAFICIIAAFIFRQTDVAKIECNPYSFWQGHSAWHLLIGAGPFCLYLFYRSETERIN